MTTLQVLSVLFAIAALFGMISTRWLKLPITVGTMLLTVLASVALMVADQIAPSSMQPVPTRGAVKGQRGAVDEPRGAVKGRRGAVRARGAR